MNPTEYRQLLLDVGFEASLAEGIVNRRFAGPAPRNQRFTPIRAAKTAEGEGEILLYDMIGFDFWTGGGFTPKTLLDQLAGLGDVNKITVRINSPGGDVFDGMTIFNILRRQEATVAVEIEGIAASAASFIAQVADPGQLKISEAGMMMIHRAFGGCLGNTNDMIAMADVLDKIDGQIAGIYAGRSGRKLDTWLNLMDAESWFTGQEAVDAKLCDECISSSRASAAIDLTILNCYRNTPTDIAARLAAIAKSDPPPANPPTETKENALDLAPRLRVLSLDD